MRAAIILLVFTSLGVISVESQGKIRCDCAVVQVYTIFSLQVTKCTHTPKISQLRGFVSFFNYVP